MHPLVRLAKEAVDLFIREKKIREVREEELTPDLLQRAGVFVCLKIAGNLRGCIGTFRPMEQTIAHETVRNAISASSCDPRFDCVRAGELDRIEYTVDVLTAPEPVRDKRELDPRIYGIIVEADGRRGLLLPDIDGVDTAEAQIDIAMRKACIAAGSAVSLFRFEVKRYQ